MNFSLSRPLSEDVQLMANKQGIMPEDILRKAVALYKVAIENTSKEKRGPKLAIVVDDGVVLKIIET